MGFVTWGLQDRAGPHVHCSPFAGIFRPGRARSYAALFARAVCSQPGGRLTAARLAQHARELYISVSAGEDSRRSAACIGAQSPLNPRLGQNTADAEETWERTMAGSIV